MENVGLYRYGKKEISKRCKEVKIKMNVLEFAQEYEKVLDKYIEKNGDVNSDEVIDGREQIKRIRNDPSRHFKKLTKANEKKVKKLFGRLSK